MNIDKNVIINVKLEQHKTLITAAGDIHQETDLQTKSGTTN